MEDPWSPRCHPRCAGRIPFRPLGWICPLPNISVSPHPFFNSFPLSVCLTVRLFFHPCVYPFISPSVRPSVRLSFHCSFVCPYIILLSVLPLLSCPSFHFTFVYPSIFLLSVLPLFFCLSYHCMSVCLSAYPFCPTLRLSVSPPIRPSDRPLSFCMSFYLSVFLSVYLSVCQFFSPSVGRSFCPSIHPSIHPSASPSMDVYAYTLPRASFRKAFCLDLVAATCFSCRNRSIRLSIEQIKCARNDPSLPLPSPSFLSLPISPFLFPPIPIHVQLKRLLMCNI